MSALPPIADVNGCGAGCPLVTHSGHLPRAHPLDRANGHKRTFSTARKIPPKQDFFLSDGPRRDASALIADRATDLLLARHPRNHSRRIATVRVEFKRYAIVQDGRFVIAFCHDGISEQIPGVGR